MRYLMLVCVDPAAEPHDPAQGNIGEWARSTTRTGPGSWGIGWPIASTPEPWRLRRGRLLVTDGPFAETKEWIAGFDLLECASLEEAIQIAAWHPMARFDRIEVRPLTAEG
jgi:hypothetical protein